jgi:hypothetical protein
MAIRVPHLKLQTHQQPDPPKSLHLLAQLLQRLEWHFPWTFFRESRPVYARIFLSLAAIAHRGHPALVNSSARLLLKKRGNTMAK